MFSLNMFPTGSSNNGSYITSRRSKFFSNLTKSSPVFAALSNLPHLLGGQRRISPTSLPKLIRHMGPIFLFDNEGDLCRAYAKSLTQFDHRWTATASPIELPDFLDRGDRKNGFPMCLAPWWRAKPRPASSDHVVRIFFRRPSTKVSRSHARSGVTLVQNVETCRNRPVHHFPHKTVNALASVGWPPRTSYRKSELSVACRRVELATPDPALRPFADILPKSLQQPRHGPHVHERAVGHA